MYLIIARDFPLEKKRRKAKRVSDLGNQHHNGSHQDQIFVNLSALCLALWAKNRTVLLGALEHPTGALREQDFFFLPTLGRLCLRSSRSEYNASNS